MASADDQYLRNLTERVAWDRGWGGSDSMQSLTMEEFMNSRAVDRRLPFATWICMSSR